MLDTDFIYSLPSRKDPRKRLSSKAVDKDNGCVDFMGSTDRCGYGRYSLGKQRLGAHKVSFAIHNGPVPEGMVVMHTCDNPRCINPEHLVLGTQGDNIDDCISKGRYHHVIFGANYGGNHAQVI